MTGRPFRVTVLERDESRNLSLVGVVDRRRWRRFARKMRQHGYRGFHVKLHHVYGFPAIWVSDTFAAKNGLVPS